MNHDPVYISSDDLHSWALRMMQSASEKQHDGCLPWPFRDYSHGIRQINQGHQLKESFLESFLKGIKQVHEKTARSFLFRRFSVFLHRPAKNGQSGECSSTLPTPERSHFFAFHTPTEFISTSGPSFHSTTPNE